MNWNSHLNLLGRHAFLSPSGSSWVNYDEDKLDARFVAAMAAQRGTEMHEFAQRAIRLKIKLPNSQTPIGPYVNDAIGYRMIPEQTLFYSENCFGHADSIGFRRNKLRIHDLKTGITQTTERQLEVYAALFCLEYRFKPFDIDIELRIYQGDQVKVYEADPDDIMHIMQKIILFDKRIIALKEEALP